jgi:hypothetical protein
MNELVREVGTGANHRLHEIVWRSARRGRWLPIIVAVVCLPLVAFAANELYQRLQEDAAYRALVADVQQNGAGDRASRCYGGGDIAIATRKECTADNHSERCRAVRACARDEVLLDAERQYLFTRHDTKLAFLMGGFGVALILWSLISRLRSHRSLARAERILAEGSFASITCRRGIDQFGRKCTVIVGGELLDIVGNDGTRAKLTLLFEEVFELLELLAARGFVVETNWKPAADAGRSIVSRPTSVA